MGACALGACPVEACPVVACALGAYSVEACEVVVPPWMVGHVAVEACSCWRCMQLAAQLLARPLAEQAMAPNVGVVVGLVVVQHNHTEKSYRHQTISISSPKDIQEKINRSCNL